MQRTFCAQTKGSLVFVANELGNFRHHREHLAHAAMANGLKPILVAAPRGSTDGMDYDYRPVTIERFRFDPILDLKLFFSLFRLLMVEKPDGVHFINIKPYLFGGMMAQIARQLGWKGHVVMTVPGLGRLYDPHDRTWAASFRRAIVEHCLRFATRDAHVTFETAHDRDFWVARGLIHADQAIVTQGTGIDLARFSNVRTLLPPSPMAVLFAGRLLRSKGLDAFLQAAQSVSDSSISFLVAGSAEDDPDAVSEQELREHKNIRFLGPVTDMPALLAETDLVVLPSRYNEGVPRILIEAAACGCVPVATRFAGSEALIAHGKTGYFLYTSDPRQQAEELAALVTSLAEDFPSRQRIGANAARAVRENGFSNEDVAAIFLKLYENRHHQTQAAI